MSNQNVTDSPQQRTTEWTQKAQKSPYDSRIANPIPVGLFSFASTTFLLSLVNVGAHGVRIPNIIVGMAIFVGGLLQFMAGMWEFPRGNVFEATAFSSYGCFWMSYAAIYIPGSGITAAYGTNQELSNAIGLYLVTWFMFTVMLIPAVVLRNLALASLLTTVAVTFIVLAAAEFTNSVSLTKGGGVVGVIAALMAYYVAISDLLAAEDKPVVRLPQGVW